MWGRVPLILRQVTPELFEYHTHMVFVTPRRVWCFWLSQDSRCSPGVEAKTIKKNFHKRLNGHTGSPNEAARPKRRSSGHMHSGSSYSAVPRVINIVAAFLSARVGQPNVGPLAQWSHSTQRPVFKTVATAYFRVELSQPHYRS
jgi:hypothetical protein